MVSPKQSAAAPPPPKAKREVEIEALLRWCYQDEISKEATSSAEGIWDLIQMGAAKDDGRGRGGAQRYPHFGLPHPDAYTIARAVTALPDTSTDVFDIDWLMGDLAALLRARNAILVRTIKPSVLLTHHAVMGTRPDLGAGRPEPSRITLGLNRVRIVGECRGHNLYTSGSYCPLGGPP